MCYSFSGTTGVPLPPLTTQQGGLRVNQEEIIAKLKDAAKDGKIPCAIAFKIAKECNVSTKEIGNLLNQVKIKISNCQLGCF